MAKHIENFLRGWVVPIIKGIISSAIWFLIINLF